MQLLTVRVLSAVAWVFVRTKNPDLRRDAFEHVLAHDLLNVSQALERFYICIFVENWVNRKYMNKFLSSLKRKIPILLVPTITKL
jgi:hypothetical protein